MRKLTPQQFEGAMHKAAKDLISIGLMRSIVLIAEAEAKQEISEGPNRAIRTGTLRRSITGQVLSDLRGAVGSNLSYAPFVETGTKRMRARPFLHEGIQKSIPRIVKVLTDHGIKVLDGVGK